MVRFIDVAGLLLAAGDGMRLGLGHKALLRLGGATLLQRTTRSMSACVSRVLVGAPPAMINEARFEAGDAEVHAGGPTRGETIRLLFDRCAEPYVLVHDAACPFASEALMRAVIDAARAGGAAAAYLPPMHPVAEVRHGKLINARPRTQVATVRSPLAFARPVLGNLLALGSAGGAGDASLAELCARAGVELCGVPCDQTNIKITTPLDWKIAQDVIRHAVDGSVMPPRRTREAG